MERAIRDSLLDNFPSLEFDPGNNVLEQLVETKNSTIWHYRATPVSTKREAARGYIIKSSRGYAGRSAILNEIKQLQLVQGHRHVISYYTTFAHDDTVCAILLPVAVCHLGGLMALTSKQLEGMQTATDTVHGEAGCVSVTLGGQFDHRLTMEASTRTKLLPAIAHNMCAALAWVHQVDVCHRDIKPDNILIDGAGSALLADFGKSMSGDEARNEDTMAQTALRLEFGRTYAAPETYTSGLCDAASDIFSLGAVLSEVETLIQGKTLSDYLQVRLQNFTKPSGPRGMRQKRHAETIDEAVSWVLSLSTHSTHYSETGRTGGRTASIASMMRRDSCLRPTAEFLAIALASGADLDYFERNVSRDL